MKTINKLSNSSEQVKLNATNIVVPTGAEKGKSLPKYLENMKLTKLWENPNIKQSMNYQTKIDLSSDDYDYMIWIFVFDINSTNLQNVPPVFILKGNDGYIAHAGDYNGGSGTTWYVAGYRRTIGRITDTQYALSDGYVRWGGGSAQNIVNDHLVPAIIYGGKF